jgi:hypothetical protein
VKKVQRPKPKRYWCFIHVPKTGGTSISTALGRDMYHHSGVPALHGDNPTHLTARDVRDFVGPSSWAKMFSFAVIRNPWDRVVSLYRAFDRAKGTTATFDEWFSKVEWKDIQQWYRIADEADEPIVSFVVRYERLQEDFNVICHQLGIKALALPLLNAAKGKVDYREYFKVDQVDFVRRLAAKEVQHFGYEF